MRNLEQNFSQKEMTFSRRQETTAIEPQSTEQLKAKIELYCLRTELADYVLDHFSDKALTRADVIQLIKETSCGISDALVLALVLKGQLTESNDIANSQEVDKLYEFINKKIDNKNHNEYSALT
ncbi:MAG: hypothetical protein Q4G02_01755 [bacterium]|nr:hypothetical protein [bacterium]